ncbi:MAG TPA: class I SAM-dependent methyltransferase [Methylibium sp.]|nr:class I SAM-dependent methyltransferase [Methylibium sp.]
MHRRWPLPALAAWSLAWVLFLALRQSAAPLWLAVALATSTGALLALPSTTQMRRLLVAGGFPLSLLASGAAASLPAWAWLLPLALLSLAYPLRAWQDAPFFPTPSGALDGLASLAPLPPGAAVLDAGCGVGHGMAALRRAYPGARVEGIEWSRPLAWAARLRCPWARVQRGDLWQQSWSSFSLVYLFQRPESLPRAVAKAGAELATGDWLASLEFAAAELVPQAVARAADGRPVWLYRHPFVRAVPAPDADALRRRSFSRPTDGR